jgi:two-component system, NarL family, response regulator NreC
MKIVIVEDHTLISDFLKGICKTRLGIGDVNVTENGTAGIAAILAAHPDLVLLDLHLPDIDGFSVVSSIRSIGVFPLIVVLSGFCNAYTVWRSEETRIDGFIDKNTSSGDDICEAISAAGSNSKFFSDSYRSIQRALKADPFSHPKVLSRLQHTVLQMIGSALSDSEIAERIGRSRFAAEKHRFRILGRLGLKTMPELIRYARENGFDSLGPPPAR